METSLENRDEGVLSVESIAARIAREAPTLHDLSPDQLEAVARIVMGQRLVRDLDRRVDLAGIDYPAERATFLAQATSLNTRRAYSTAMDRIEAFASRRNQSPLNLKAKDADDFAYALSTEGRASASVRRDIAAASSFYTFIERRFEAIQNPFRGTKARPDKRPSSSRVAAYPSEEEASLILSSLSPENRAAASVLVYRGLRVGALPSLRIIGERFTARSKGKDIAGTMPTEAIEAIVGAGLDRRAPFAGRTETKIADAIRYATKKLSKEGKISAAFSAHDFRHLFAIREYRRDRDIYRVSRLLSHASIQVTETYLRGLGEIDA